MGTFFCLKLHFLVPKGKISVLSGYIWEMCSLKKKNIPPLSLYFSVCVYRLCHTFFSFSTISSMLRSALCATLFSICVSHSQSSLFFSLKMIQAFRRSAISCLRRDTYGESHGMWCETMVQGHARMLQLWDRDIGGTWGVWFHIGPFLQLKSISSATIEIKKYRNVMSCKCGRPITWEAGRAGYGIHRLTFSAATAWKQLPEQCRSRESQGNKMASSNQTINSPMASCYD